MNLSIDQNQDYSNKELYQFLSGVSLPDYVKEASTENVKTAETLEKSAYADPDFRKFPINSKARVYVSNAYFVNKVAELANLRGTAYVEKIAANIQKAAEAYGILGDLQDYNAVAIENRFADYVDRTIVVKVAGDNEFDLFTIKTASDVQNEADRFITHLDNYPYEWRRPISEQFVKAAEAFGIDELPDLIVKYAGQYFPDIVAIKDELNRRMTKLSSQKDKETYAKLAADANDIVDSVEDIFKIADICYFTEKNAGLYDKPHYVKILGDPVDKFFTLHSTKVAELMDVVTMAGEKYASSDLERVPADIFEKAFGFVPKVAEYSDILPTMPKSDVNLFRQLSGVNPI